MEDFKRLEKWWWSPEHPHNYVATHPETGQPAGVGVLLRKAPDAALRFNLTWLVHGESLKTWEGCREGVCFISSLKPLMDKPALGGTLGELSCLYTKEQFLKYCKENRVKLPGLQNA
jgi:hypothetical protein